MAEPWPLPAAAVPGHPGQTDVPGYPMPRTRPFEPPALYSSLRVEQPVARVRLWDGTKPWLVTRHSDVRALLADPRLSAAPHQAGYPLISPGRTVTSERDSALNHLDPPEHDRHRRLVAREFTVRRMRALRPVIEEAVDTAIDRMCAMGPPADLVAGFALAVPSQVICHLLGIPYTDHVFFHTRSAVRMDLGATGERVRTAHLEIVAYLDALVAERGRRTGDDLISRLLPEVAANRLSHDELVDTARLLLVNGYETTANMIALAALVLLEHPAAYRIAQAGTDGELRDLVEELLRYLTIVHLAPVRAVLADIDLYGQLVRAGEGAILSLIAANHDPVAFPDPERFNPRREARYHLAFGHGVHQCLGHVLARMELAAACRALTRRLAGLRLAVPINELRFKYDSALYGVHEAPVTWGGMAR